MGDLSSRLKAYGVKKGAGEITTPPPKSYLGLDSALPGKFIQVGNKDLFVVEKFIPIDCQYLPLLFKPSAQTSAFTRWLKDPRFGSLSPESLAFIDIETTDLTAGPVTYPFLICAGRFEGDFLHLMQFFLRTPAEEIAQLTAFEMFLAPCQAIVSFNGKSFDVPHLRTRYLMNRQPDPLVNLVSVDLFHLGRKLWRNRLPDCSLKTVEREILNITRTEADIPGWMAPIIYKTYRLDGDPLPLKGVFYHNEMDVLSLALLLNNISGHLFNVETPPQPIFGLDLLAQAIFFDDVGDRRTATRLYSIFLEENDRYPIPAPEVHKINAILRLANCHKTEKNFPQAIVLLETAAVLNSIQAHIELAKIYEHHLRDIQVSYRWVNQALELLNSPDSDLSEFLRWSTDLNYRSDRLTRKLTYSR